MSIGSYNTTDGLVYKTGKNDIVESLIRIIFTLPGERVGNPEFGCNLRGLLFEPEYIFLDEIANEVNKACLKFENRVFLKNIDLEKINYNEYKVHLIFKYKTNEDTIAFTQTVIT